MLHIVIIDDHPFNLILIKKQLSSLDCQITTFNQSIEALHFIQNNASNISIVLTDIMMPNLNGFELVSKLKSEKQTHSMPVIAITSGLFNREDIINSQNSFSEVIYKPYKPEELKKNILELTSIADKSPK